MERTRLDQIAATAPMPLPPGWSDWQSEPYMRGDTVVTPGRFYATAPYAAWRMDSQERMRLKLEQTISDETREGLVRTAWQQQHVYDTVVTSLMEPPTV